VQKQIFHLVCVSPLLRNYQQWGLERISRNPGYLRESTLHRY
jgi:hypothetical protein